MKTGIVRSVESTYLGVIGVYALIAERKLIKTSEKSVKFPEILLRCKMDNGGYKIIYDLEPYMIDDCGTYFMVYKNYKHVASFWNRKDAFDYCKNFGE